MLNFIWSVICSIFYILVAAVVMGAILIVFSKRAKDNMMIQLDTSKIEWQRFVQKQLFTAFQEVDKEYVKTNLKNSMQISVDITYMTKIDNNYLNLQQVYDKYFLGGISYFTVAKVKLPEEHVKILNRSKLRASLYRIFNNRYKSAEQQCKLIRGETWKKFIFTGLADWEKEIEMCDILSIPLLNDVPQDIRVSSIKFLPDGYTEIEILFYNQPYAKDYDLSMTRKVVQKKIYNRYF